MVWLATDPRALETNGQFWLDRRPRSVAPLPWTRTSDADAERCWSWCVDRAGVAAPLEAAHEDRHRRHRRLRAGRRPPAAPPPRHHRVRVRHTSRRPHQHRRRRGRRPVGRGRHRLHRLQRAQLPGFVRCSTARRGDPADRDELQRQRSPHRARVPGHEPQHALRPAAQPRQPSFLRLLADIVRFNRAARRLVAGEARWNGPDRLPDGGGSTPTPRSRFADFLRRGRYSELRRQFLVPLGASIWSADPATFTRFPVRAYARFMDNHGLLELAGLPEWRTVTGGSRRYVEALIAPFADRIRLDARAQGRHPRRRRRLDSSSCSPTTARNLRPGDPRDPQRPGVRMLADPTPPSARSSARSATSPTWPRCTPTSASCRATHGPGPAGTTRSPTNARGTDGDLLDEPPAVDRDSTTRCSSR